MLVPVKNRASVHFLESRGHKAHNDNSETLSGMDGDIECWHPRERLSAAASLCDSGRS